MDALRLRSRCRRDIIVSRVDRILDVLDNTGQDSGEASYGDFDRTRCWRCQGEPGDGPSGVCDGCRAVLLDETTEPSAPRFVGEPWADLGQFIDGLSRLHDRVQERVRRQGEAWDELFRLRAQIEAQSSAPPTDTGPFRCWEPSAAERETMLSPLSDWQRWAYGQQHVIVQRVGVGVSFVVVDEWAPARREVAPTSRTAASKPPARRRAIAAPPCHHSNPRNACRECSMGRR